jgi:hypothetical protein
MGYPMTFRRVVNRNGLGEGDYSGNLPYQWSTRGVVPEAGDPSVYQLPFLVERIRGYERGLHMLLGDLRRLEADTVDENTTCKHIASRTGIDVDTVAAVLKEFMSW